MYLEDRRQLKWAPLHSPTHSPSRDGSIFMIRSPSNQVLKLNKVQLVDRPSSALSDAKHGNVPQLLQSGTDQKQPEFLGDGQSLALSDSDSYVVDTEVVAIQESICSKDEENDAHLLDHPSPELSAEKFHDAFHRHRSEGLIAVSGLKAVLSEFHIEATEEEIASAVKDLYPDLPSSDKFLTYDKAEEVYRSFLHQKKQPQRSGPVNRKGCLSSWLASLSDEKATNVLLFVVAVACTLSALLAASIALILMTSINMETPEKDLIDELAVMNDISLAFFWDIAGGSMGNKLSSIISTLAVVVDTSYNSMVAAEKRHLAAILNRVAIALSTWVKHQPAMHPNRLTHISDLWMSCAGKVCDTASLPIANDTTNDQHLSCSMAVSLWQNASHPPVQGHTDSRNADMRHLLQRLFEQQNLPSAQWPSEFFLARHGLNGAVELLVAPASCDFDCMEFLTQSGSPFEHMLADKPVVIETPGPLGALTAFMSLGTSGLGLAVQTANALIVQRVVSRLTVMVDKANQAMGNRTEELELFVERTANGNKELVHVSQLRFRTQCPASGCLQPEYLKQVLLHCTCGQTRTTDYRGVEVIVAYRCLADLNAVISIKVDIKHLERDALLDIIAVADKRNSYDTARTDEFSVAVPNAGKTPAEVKGFEDFTLMTKLKYSDACSDPDCKWDQLSELRALQGVSGAIDTLDYRSVPRRVALSRLDISGGIAMVLAIDSIEFNAPVTAAILAIFGFTIGATAVFMAVLVSLTKRSLRLMIVVQERGRRDVEKEKNDFSQLVASMYPAYVVPQLLAGEKENMVLEVSNGCVFFSDITDFTSASNTLNSTELVSLMGYVYGVMDTVASHYGVQKVKTIGDAYLAIAGLPGSRTTNPSLDMLHFASSVAQVFSDRFCHPVEGQILDVMNQAMARRRRRAQRAALGTEVPSFPRADTSSFSVSGGFKPTGLPGRQISSFFGSPDTVSRLSLGSRALSMAPLSSRTAIPRNSVAAGSNTGDKKVTSMPITECIMSYGLASGPVITGVLQGRCPMFDIWGVTVNLASRMQSTGQPGCIQVSEQVHRQVISVVGQPFYFEAERTIHCKGFGNVHAYFVGSSNAPIPGGLMDTLHLRPRYDLFHFEDVLKDYTNSQAIQIGVISSGSSNAPAKLEELKLMEDPHHIVLMEMEDI